MEDLQVESIVNEGGLHVLRLSGPFVLRTMFEFQELVREGDAPVTLIDLTAVPYMDSAALGALLGFHVSCQRQARKYAIVGASDRLQTMFRVAGVHNLLVAYTSLEAARSAVSSS